MMKQIKCRDRQNIVFDIIAISQNKLIPAPFFNQRQFRENRMNQLIEEIKPIQDYEGLYGISNYGYVISLAKEWINGRGVRKKEKTILKTVLDGDGYSMVVLCKNKTRKTYKMSLLVYDHFGEGERNGRILQVDHIKERWNDRIDNLQLLTCRENVSKGFIDNGKKSSSYAGIDWHKRAKKWRARIRINKKQIHLGLFVNEIKASNKYQETLKNLIH